MVGFIRESHLARSHAGRGLAVACLSAALLFGCEQLEGTGGDERGQPSEPMGQADPQQPEGEERVAQRDQQLDPMSPLGRAQAQETPEPAEQPMPLEEQQPQQVQPEQQQQAQQQQPQQQPQQQQQAQQQPQPQQQPEQQQQPQQQQRAEMPAPPSGDEAALIRGTVEGTARSVDLARGTVTIESGGQEVNLQAHPSDLARIQTGDSVVLGFTSYPDGSQWIEPTADASDVLDRSDSVGQLTGQIEAIDGDAGIVAVGGQTFRAHPEQLEELAPGESVSLSYAEIEETPWIAEVEAGQDGAMASAEVPDALDQEQTESDIDWLFEN